MPRPRCSKFLQIGLLQAGVLAAGPLLLAACGGNSGGGSTSSTTFVIGGSVSGLLPNTTVVLQDNGGNTTPLSVNASFSFSTPVPAGGPFDVTVESQPVGEVCTVQNAAGTVTSANVSVAVGCIPTPYTVGGSVQGLLAGNSLTLTLNGANGTLVAANGPFAFGQTLNSQNSYTVAVNSTSAMGQTCTLTGGSGEIIAANITNVNVACSANSYSVEVGVFGMLAGSSATVQLNGTTSLTVTDGATFTFPTSLLTQSPYAVTITAQPSGQTCFFQGNGSGIVSGANIALVLVCPWHVLYLGGIPNYIDPTSGALLGATGVAANANPSGFVVFDPRLPVLYTSNPQVRGVFEYTIDPKSGVLSLDAGSPYSTPYNRDDWIAIDSSGNFLYTVGASGDELPGLIEEFSIDPSSGALDQLTPTSVASPAPAPAIADPAGNFLFTGAGTFAIDPSTGALTNTDTTTEPGAALLSSCSLAIDPMGRFLYSVVLTGPGISPIASVTSQAIDPASGNLTPAPGSPYPIPTGCALAAAEELTVQQTLEVTPDGRFLYAAGSGSISAFSVDLTTGALTPVAGSPFVYTGSGSIVIDPAQQFLYASGNLNSSPIVLAYMIDPTTGALTPFTAAPTMLGDIAINAVGTDDLFAIFPLVH
jgi:6-phosphogluconolactonase (cycloisomerase 2 family)